MALLPRPVTMMMFCMPELRASSTPYWIIGLSTIGSISLGCALVAGRNRVPSPAAGKTAFRTLAGIYYSLAPISACWQPVRPAFVHAGLFPALSALMALLTRTARAAGTLGWRVRLFRIGE